MLVSALRSLLGFATVGLVWTVRGETLLNSSDSYGDETEGKRHRRAEAVQKRVLLWLNSYNNETEGVRRRRAAKAGVLLWGNDLRAQWLKAHNDIRRDSSKMLQHSQPAAANMMRMYWNGYLEASALAWAWFNCRNWKHGQDDKVVKSAKFVKQLGKFGSFIGQNIQHNTGDVIAPYIIVQAYGGETVNNDYNGQKGKCKPGKDCGHYTQIMWHSTWLVGCAYASCATDKGITSVCNYLPGGNIGDNPPYTPGTPCSGCSAYTKPKFTSCQNNLCAPKDPCSAVIDCKVTDKSNCLCDDEVYHRLVKEILPKNIPIDEKFGNAKPDPNSAGKGPGKTEIAVVSNLFLPFVVILLGHGVQRVFDSGLL